MAEMSSYVKFFKTREGLSEHYKTIYDSVSTAKGQESEYIRLVTKGTELLQRFENGEKLSDFELERLREFKIHTNNLQVHTGLISAKVFELDKIKKRIMLLTDKIVDKALLEDLHLPFPQIFLDIDILPEELPDYSEIALGDVMNVYGSGFGKKTDLVAIRGILVAELAAGYANMIQPSIQKEKVSGNVLFVACCVESVGELSIQNFLIDVHKVGINYEYGGLKPIADFLHGFIQKFLAFLNHPEIEWVERKRENQKNRVKRGLIPLPSSNVIRLTGKLRLFSERHRNLLGAEHFDFSQWVRGYLKHFRSPYYVNVRGRTKWVEAYLKNEGKPMRDSSYILKASKDDKKNYLFFDDIPVGEKPLSEKLKKRRFAQNVRYRREQK